MVQRLFISISIIFAASDVVAGYPARDAWIPVAGHIAKFNTTVYMTNLSRSTNDITISFFPTAQPNASPQHMKVQLGPAQTAAVDIGPLTGEGGAIGGLRIRGTGRLIATARVYSESRQGTVFNAIPSRLAIGTHETTLLQVSTGGRYKLYAVETHGFPLYFSVMAEPSGNERRLYLSPNEHHGWDLDELFRGMNVSALRITGISGSGKIIVAGTTVSQDASEFAAFEMTLPTEPRHQLRWPEISAYAAVAIAIVVAIVLNRR